jgi:hypothetical protein
MEKLASLWNYAPFIAAAITAAVVMTAIVLVVLWVVRSHPSTPARSARPAPQPPTQPPLTEIDADLLDSSHIGFAPLVGSVSLPSGDRGKNGS